MVAYAEADSYQAGTGRVRSITPRNVTPFTLLWGLTARLREGTLNSDTLARKGGDANMGSHSCYGVAGLPVRGSMGEVIFA